MNPLIQLKCTSLPLLTALMLACFALAPQARAVCQEGCDASNGNTFPGEDALVNNTTGSANTATGVEALWSNTTGGGNTATDGSTFTMGPNNYQVSYEGGDGNDLTFTVVP